MSTYAIGDVQGCFDALMQLLNKINFNPANDQLWFVGDLVNRGNKSLETLRFIKALGPKAISVLGNHDLGMLTVARGAEPYQEKHHTFDDILNAPDKDELLLWLEQRPLMYYDPKLNYLLVHAGLYPWWDLNTALNLAKEVESILQSEQKFSFYKHHYGNIPEKWQDNLQGPDRLRFIVNACTRMRFCSQDGKLDLITKESLNNPNKDYLPWFEILDQKNKSEKNLNLPKIVFGHWAALQGKCPVPNMFALDTGCVWGSGLTAMRLEDELRFSIVC